MGVGDGGNFSEGGRGHGELETEINKNEWRERTMKKIVFYLKEKSAPCL